MKIQVENKNIVDVSADAIIVNLFSGVTKPGGATGAVDKELGGLIQRLIASKEFKGELNETAVLHVAADRPYRKVVVVGLGEQEQFCLEKARQAAASAIRTATKGDVRRIATIIHGAGIGGLDVSEATKSVVEGTLLAQYRYEQFKTSESESDEHELVIVEMEATNLAVIEQAVQEAEATAEATNWARDLVNAPSNDMTPARMAEQALQMAEQMGLECTVLERDDMEELGMGALLGVAQGSVQLPKLIVLRYKGADEEPLALVGKGVTFDTGGISIKPSQGMAEMKGDMAGAAAVLGAMRAIAAKKPKRHVIGIAACVENMPSGQALKPGDILRTMTGKTIEVDNTDAEGRLVLADAVAYAESLDATTIIDVATLTGACIVALGNFYAAVIANDDELAQNIIEAGKQVGERYWALPSDEEYKTLYKSDVADIKNVGPRGAGTITGGLIIGEFVKDARWAHLDIAGTGFTKEDKHYMKKGGTGHTVRTLVQYACS